MCAFSLKLNFKRDAHGLGKHTSTAEAQYSQSQDRQHWRHIKSATELKVRYRNQCGLVVWPLYDSHAEVIHDSCQRFVRVGAGQSREHLQVLGTRLQVRNGKLVEVQHSNSQDLKR
jgi:hypothetical protein